MKTVDFGARSLFVDGLSDSDAIEAFVAAGGDVARALTPQEVRNIMFLKFDVSYVHHIHINCVFCY